MDIQVSLIIIYRSSNAHSFNSLNLSLFGDSIDISIVSRSRVIVNGGFLGEMWYHKVLLVIIEGAHVGGLHIIPCRYIKHASSLASLWRYDQN